MEIWQERAHEDQYNIDWRDKVGHGRGERAATIRLKGRGDMEDGEREADGDEEQE